MQHIPDNEFDRLFKDRLADADVQPSAELWDRIAPQVAAKKKRNVGLYWSAAASVMIALTAGMLFRPQEKIALRAPVSAVAAQKQSAENTAEVFASETSKVVRDTRVSSSVPATVYEREASSITEAQSVESTDNILAAVQPAAKEDHHINTKPVEEAIVSAPIEKTTAESALAINSAPVEVETATTEAITETTAVEQQTRPRIRNAGDLVNFVVDKIDKREQKLVEFRTDEDEGSSLVAINIGPLKINQRRHR